ncbi:hypothetical protein VE03_04239 [Pseudogymnoascus sp. 23342-1-I1]|nr:hypothetical protein VE03_04239 [Pseudogymnoascus sp. 23342-1-I1]
MSGEIRDSGAAVSTKPKEKGRAVLEVFDIDVLGAGDTLKRVAEELERLQREADEEEKAEQEKEKAELEKRSREKRLREETPTRKELAAISEARGVISACKYTEDGCNCG